MPLIGDRRSDTAFMPERVNYDPYGNGWIIQMVVEDTSELVDLMTSAEYSTYLEKEYNEG